MRATDRPMTLIDIALMHQAVHLDPVLAAISDFIDEYDDIAERVRRDLPRSLKNPDTGRPGLTPPQVVRSMLLMRIENWDLRERIADGYSLRQFTGFYSDDVPSITRSTAASIA
jgi:IS5 family transposase